MAVVSALVLAGKGYLVIGALFAAWFAYRGAGRLDPAASGSTAGFRLLLVPGAALLWPYLALRLRRVAR
jgi:hypothetical protein